MPVTGTPQNCQETLNPCTEVQVFEASYQVVDGQTLFNKRSGVVVPSGMPRTILFNFVDKTRSGMNLKLCDPGIAIKVRMYEAVLENNTVEIDGYIHDEEKGTVGVNLTKDHLSTPGVYVLEYGLFDSAGDIFHSRPIYLIVEPSAWGKLGTGIPHMDEIRLFLRDADPSENSLLERIDFPDAEIAAAIVRAIRRWNELPPRLIRYTFDSRNFPYKNELMQGIAGFLFIAAAESYRRNFLPYNTGGISIQDKNKFNLYEQIGRLNLNEYTQWAKMKKVELNRQQAMVHLLSPYSRALF